MTNLECVVAVLARHRAARRWTDDAVAADLMVHLGLDPAGTPATIEPSLVTEGQVAVAEAAARAAFDEFLALRDTFRGQTAPPEPEPAPPVSDKPVPALASVPGGVSVPIMQEPVVEHQGAPGAEAQRAEPEAPEADPACD